jgi:hypothetical protein
MLAKKIFCSQLCISSCLLRVANFEDRYLSLEMYLQRCCQMVQQLRKSRLQSGFKAPRQYMHVFDLVAQQRTVFQREQMPVVWQELRLEQIDERFERETRAAVVALNNSKYRCE